MEPLPFLEDIYPENLLYAAVIRSPVAKGRLKSVQAPELPENYTLITAKEIPGENLLEGTKIPVLAFDNLSYIGEPAAILLGNDKTKLEELASGCEIIAEEEKPVFHPEAKIGAIKEIKTGDINEAFEKAENICKGKYSTGIQAHWYAEPAGAVAWYSDDKEKKLIVRTATQWPNHVNLSVSRVLGIENESVSVMPTALNLHMDGKLFYPSFIACHAALGTFITKKPVRLVLSKEEDFLFSPKRFGSEIEIESSVDKNGVITGAKIDIFVNLGSREVYEKEIMDQICLGSLGFYNFKNLLLTVRTNYANIPPQGPFSGFGLAQGLFAIERHVSQIAQIYKKDPAEWRKSSASSKLITSQSPKNNNGTEKIINLAAKLSDFYRKWDSYELLRQAKKEKPSEGSFTESFTRDENPRGIGMALGFQGNSLLYPNENDSYSVEVTFTKESVLEISSNIVSSEDYCRIWEKTAAAIMSMEPEKIKVISQNSPDCGPSCSSRNITAVTKLVERCCNAIRKQLFHDPLPITVRRSMKLMPGSLRSEKLEVTDISGFVKPGMAAAVVEVTIDLVEFIPVIRGVYLAVDGGNILSRNRAKRSLYRGITQALGWSFTENLEYINGKLPSTQYDNYTIFSPSDIPKIHIDFIPNESGDSRGIGELPFTCIPAAFLQAVSQAADHCFTSIPLKRNDIWEKK